MNEVVLVSSCGIGEELDEDFERVVVGVGDALREPGAALGDIAPVVDQVEGGELLVLGDAVERDNLRGVHDCAGHAGLNEFVEEHGVEYGAGDGLEPEGDIGEPAGELDIWVRLGDAPGAFDQG